MPLWGRDREPASPPRLLVVDDDEPLRSTLVRVLRRAGYTVEETEDARWALARLTGPGPRIDAVVCDIVMPLMNGIVFGERLRRRGLEVPILYISGLAEESALRDWGVPVTTPFLAKPFEPYALLSAVDGLLRERGEERRPGS